MRVGHPAAVNIMLLHLRTPEMTYWRWHLGRMRQGKSKFLLGTALLAASIIYSWHNLSTQSTARTFLISLFRLPLFDVGIAILVVSNVVLSYMEYKVAMKEISPVEGRLWSISRQKIIPREYARLYGHDMLVRIFRGRFVFFLCCVAAVVQLWYRAGK